MRRKDRAKISENWITVLWELSSERNGTVRNVAKSRVISKGKDKTGKVLRVPTTPKKRYSVVGPWHGETKTLWYVFDNKNDEWVETVYSKEAATKRCSVLNRR